jgi:hypothetical protein
MPLPLWIQQQAYEEYIAQEQDFQEWLTRIEQQYEEELSFQEYYLRPQPRHIRTKRRYAIRTQK